MVLEDSSIKETTLNDLFRITFQEILNYFCSSVAELKSPSHKFVATFTDGRVIVTG